MVMVSVQSMGVSGVPMGNMLVRMDMCRGWGVGVLGIELWWFIKGDGDEKGA